MQVQPSTETRGMTAETTGSRMGNTFVLSRCIPRFPAVSSAFPRQAVLPRSRREACRARNRLAGTALHGNARDDRGNNGIKNGEYVRTSPMYPAVSRSFQRFRARQFFLGADARRVVLGTASQERPYTETRGMTAETTGSSIGNTFVLSRCIPRFPAVSRAFPRKAVLPRSRRKACRARNCLAGTA